MIFFKTGREQSGRFTKKETKIENEKKKKGKTKKQKKRKFTRNKVQKKRGDIFSNVREMKNRWYKNFTQKGDVKHNSNFQNIFENQGILFFKNGQKRNRKKMWDFSKRRFSLFKKVEKTRKTGDAKVDRTKTPKTIATIRKDKRNKTKCAHQKNKTKSTK